jgi:hypothetical protein
LGNCNYCEFQYISSPLKINYLGELRPDTVDINVIGDAARLILKILLS